VRYDLGLRLLECFPAVAVGYTAALLQQPRPFVPEKVKKTAEGMPFAATWRSQ